MNRFEYLDKLDRSNDTNKYPRFWKYDFLDCEDPLIELNDDYIHFLTYNSFNRIFLLNANQMDEEQFVEHVALIFGRVYSDRLVEKQSNDGKNYQEKVIKFKIQPEIFDNRFKKVKSARFVVD